MTLEGDRRIGDGTEMEELKDLSGPFREDFRLENLSKEALIRGWVQTSEICTVVSGYWRNLIMEKFPDADALALEREVWLRLYPYEHFDRMIKALNIGGNDVETVLKFTQIDPFLGIIYPMRFELKNKNHGVITVDKCPVIEMAETSGSPKAEAMAEWACGIDSDAIPKMAAHANPNMKVTCLKKFGQRSEDDPHCQWEFKIEP